MKYINDVDSQKAFEKFIKENGAKIVKDRNGQYKHAITAIAWDAWKAALKFSEIEMNKGVAHES